MPNGSTASTLRGAGQTVAGAGRNPRSRKVRTPQGKGGRGNTTRGNPRESATENNRLSDGVARESRCRQGGKGAVRAHRRRGDAAARQTPPGARPSRTDDPARVGPGRPPRWMVAQDRIRLIGPLKKRPLRGPLPLPDYFGQRPD